MVEVIIVLVVVGVCLYLINAYVPMAGPVKTVLNALIVIALCVWLLNVFGIIDWRLPGRLRN